MKSSSSKEIVFLSKHFYPEVTSTGQLLTELAEALRKGGFNPQVITISPPGIKNELSYQGIPITRVFSTSFSKKNTLGRLINDLSFLASSFIKLWSLDRRAIIFVVSNPPFMPLLGWIFKKLRNMDFVYLVHDVYPEIAINLGFLKKNGLIAKIWNYFNRQIISSASTTIVLGDCMKKKIMAKVNPGQGNVVVVPNWCDENLIVPIDKKQNQFAEEYGLKDKFVVLYSGNLGLFQDLEAIIQVAESLINYKDIVFLFIGEGGKKDKLIRMVKEKKLPNVQFLPYQDKNKMSLSYGTAEVDIITLEKGAEGLGVPSKLYTIMASGRPIIALLGRESEVASVISKAECGYVLDQGNTDEFKNKIIQLYNNRQLGETMGIKARGYFEKHFSKTIIMDKYFALFTQLFQIRQQ